ncbi:MAG: 50S ribosomal protein L1 [Methanocellales archaeon]|nr:50S ribosomal protein L1 [Methanocellales archaeon]
MARKDILQAVKTALGSPERNFTESVDLAINLKNIDMGQPQNRIDEAVVLPSGVGKPVKIAVFASEELAIAAKEAGADIILPLEQIDKLKKDKAKSIADEYDFLLAEVQLMPSIGKNLGQVLGPRGKMPDPIPPNTDITPIIKRLRKTVKLRSRDKKTFHTMVGSKSMAPEEIAANIEAILKHIEAKLEKGVQNIRSIYVKTTMGPAEKVM